MTKTEQVAVDLRHHRHAQSAAYVNGPLGIDAPAFSGYTESGNGQPARYAHIKDLQRRAQVAYQDYGPYTPVTKSNQSRFHKPCS